MKILIATLMLLFSIAIVVAANADETSTPAPTAHFE